MKKHLFLIISFIALAFPLSAKLNQGLYLCESKGIMINIEVEILSIYNLGLELSHGLTYGDTPWPFAV